MIKMRTVILGAGCLLSVWIAGCSSDVTESEINEPVEIRLNGGIASSALPATRGVGMVNGTSPLWSTLSVNFARADADASGTYASAAYSTLSATITAASSGTDHTIAFTPSPIYYQANGQGSKLIAWYPTGTLTSGSITSAALDGSTDIMVTPLYEGKKASGSQMTAVSLKHVLTQISVMAYAESADAKTVWGGIKSVKVEGKKETCIIQLPAVTDAAAAEATVTFGGSGTDLDLVTKNPSDNQTIQEDGSDYSASNPLKLGVATTTPTAATNAVLAGYAMFAPSTSDITLKVEMENGGVQTVTVAAPTTGTAGFLKANSYVVTLKFTATGISPKVNISDWQTGTTIPDISI